MFAELKDKKIQTVEKPFGVDYNWPIYYINIHQTFSLKSCFTIRDQINQKTFLDHRSGPFSEIASPSHHSTKSYKQSS